MERWWVGIRIGEEQPNWLKWKMGPELQPRTQALDREKLLRGAEITRARRQSQSALPGTAPTSGRQPIKEFRQAQGMTPEK